MKKLIATTLLTTALALLGHFASFAQTVVTGSAINVSSDSTNTIGTTTSGAVVGKNNSVSSFLSYAFGEKISIGQYATGSFVFGSSDTVTLSQSICLGSHNEVSSMGGLALGRYLDAGGSSGTFVIGEGISAGHKLSSNHDHGLAIGFGSTKPTVFVSTSPNNTGQGIFNKTGKVAIGDVTPQAKLHIRSDAGEDAGIILVPAQPSNNNTFIRLRDNNHSITVNSSGKMDILAGASNQLDMTSANLSVMDTRLDLGRSNERKITMVSGYTPAIYSNAYRSEGSYYRHMAGPSYAIEFGYYGLLLRTATNQDPRTEITNWRDALSVKTDGDITLNGLITLDGKVGVNTKNTTPNFALAVDGGIIATEVYVMEVENWPDYVFNNNYELLSLQELKQFIGQHHHLPEVPSEKETLENGWNLGEMQKMLLKKIEELTLYIIQQDERISQLEKELSTNH